MSHGGDPDRIYQAQRAGIFMRLASVARLDWLDAEYWIVQWEHEAEAMGRERGSAGYWDDAWTWILAQRAVRGQRPG